MYKSHLFLTVYLQFKLHECRFLLKTIKKLTRNLEEEFGDLSKYQCKKMKNIPQ